MRMLYGLLLAVCVSLGPVVQADVTQSPAGAEVYIVSPNDGDVVAPTFTVVFGLKGMGAAPSAPAGLSVQ